MYLCCEIIMNGISDQSESPLKSSQSLSAITERLFTFQPGLRPGYYAPVLKSAFHRACKCKGYLPDGQTLALEVNAVAEYGGLCITFSGFAFGRVSEHKVSINYKSLLEALSFMFARQPA